MHREDECELVRSMLVRDRGAWRQFVDTYQGLVRARVVRTAAETQRRLDAADIEDVCAEVFAGLLINDLASLRRFEGRSSLATWLSVVARRICLQWLSRRTIGSQATGSIDEVADDAAARCRSDDVLGRLIDGEDARRLNSMLNRLNEADQTVLRMFYLQGRSYADISRQLQISINSVGAKLQRAQKRLRQLLETREVAHEDH